MGYICTIERYIKCFKTFIGIIYSNYRIIDFLWNVQTDNVGVILQLYQ